MRFIFTNFLVENLKRFMLTLVEHSELSSFVYAQCLNLTYNSAERYIIHSTYSYCTKSVVFLQPINVIDIPLTIV
jgi:hypothetical protein